MNGTATDPQIPDYGVNLVPDIDFAVKDPTVIENEVIVDYQTAFKELTNIAKVLAPADPVRLHLLTVCHWLSHQRVLIDFTGKENLLKYSHDDYLDNLAALHGDRTIRLAASPALTTFRFTLTAPLAFDAVIPKGTQLGANNLVFQTTKDGIIPSLATTCDVPAQCLTDGTVGNGFAVGQITQVINWNQPWAVTAENITVTGGGSDRETDDQYRYRIWLAIESYSIAGPHDAYEFWALSAHPDIIQAVVYSAPEIAGEVWIFPLLRGGLLPTPEILAAVLAKCNPNTVRPVSDFVSVFAPTPFVYTLRMHYWVSTSTEVLLSTIQNGVTQAVADWILWQRSYVSRDLNCDELIRRVIEAGAKRVVIDLPSPTFQVMAYNQLACHDDTVPPDIRFEGLEDP